MKVFKQLLNIQLKKLEQKCPIHGTLLVYVPGLTKVAPFCQECQKQKRKDEVRVMKKSLVVKLNRGYLKTYSLVDRPDTYQMNFETFKAAAGSKEEAVKNAARHIAGLYLKEPDKKFNTLFYGRAGAGKTQLAMAILNAVNNNIEPLLDSRNTKSMVVSF